MADLLLSAWFWLLCLYALSAVTAAVALGRWLLETPDREAAAYALAVGVVLSGCASSNFPNDRLVNEFFSGPADAHHREWVARIKGGAF